MVSSSDVAKRFRKQNLRNKTPQEKVMKRMLTDLDIKFKQQFIVANPKSFYIIDFMLLGDCPIAIECDGDHHTYNSQQATHDRERTVYLASIGISTIRINNHILTESRYLDTKRYLSKAIKRIRVKQVKLA